MGQTLPTHRAHSAALCRLLPRERTDTPVHLTSGYAANKRCGMLRRRWSASRFHRDVIRRGQATADRDDAVPHTLRGNSEHNGFGNCLCRALALIPLPHIFSSKAFRRSRWLFQRRQDLTR